jgi:hypothetical protein
MIDDATALLRREYRAARRLARLFRIERSGSLARRSSEIARCMIERRGKLIGELGIMDIKRLSLAPEPTPDLDLAMRSLAREVDRAEQRCREVIAELGAELERRRGMGAATGLRDGAGGRLLGSG